MLTDISGTACVLKDKHMLKCLAELGPKSGDLLQYNSEEEWFLHFILKHEKNITDS